MYVLIYFLSVSLSQYISNITMDVTTDNEENFNYSRQDSLLLIGLFIVAIILQAVNNLIINYAIWVMLVYLLVSVSITLTLTTLRKQRIEKTREEITQIYEILHNLVDKKGKGVDFNNVPFTLEHKYNTINKIDVIVDPITFDDKYLPEYLNQLNNFLSTYTWNYELHLEERKISFVGYDKPPTVARWKGSWLRPTRFFSLGITGKGEFGWLPDKVDKKRLGKSQFLDEMGNPLPADMELPSAPQGLVCGAPLSLDTIIPTTKGYKTMGTIQVGDYVFDRNNTPTKVVNVLDIHLANKMYLLTFVNDKGKKIKIKSDEVHRFPTYINSNTTEPINCEFLLEGDVIIGNNSVYTLESKEEIPQEDVRCITVESPEHIFLICDKKRLFFGGKRYPYDAVFTYNTGGGKSVAIQNIIYGGIAHRNEVALSLIDPKYTEFSAYKNMKGIVGVANTTEETVEVLRIAKLAMYQRNQILAELKLKNIMDYTPTKKSGLVYVTGRDYREDDIIKVRANKVESTIPAKDLVELVNTNTHDVIEVCLNDKDWIEVNYNCVDFIYSDEMKMLVTVLDELAEATQKSGIKDQKAKEQDALKDEIINLVTSITQLGRSSAIHIISATQKPNSTVVPTILRSNPLALDTLVETLNQFKVTIRDIKVGDKILGTDNQYYEVIDKTPVHIPTKVYSVSFTNGNVICSDTHQWTVHTSDNSYSYVTESEDLVRNRDWFIENDIHFGRYEDNIKLLDVSLVEQTECVCITTNSPDNQFLIYTDSGNPIYTHNCGFRAFCGRATETGASLVALDNNLATTIDSTYPGMGIVQSGGKNEFIRYYFSKFEDLEEYYRQRGLDELGYSPIDSEFSGNGKLEDLEGEIEITINRDKSKYEFEENSVEIDNREEQDWREV